MKIISITIVNNGADIIESFVRYHLNIVDEMIILDNRSNDNTRNILNQLKKEGLPLIIIHDNENFKPIQKLNELLEIAIERYDADIICPLDVDEFISYDYGHPRSIFEKFDQSTYYKIKLRTYVPTIYDEIDESFIPSKITHAIYENSEKYKIFFHKFLFDEFDVKFSEKNDDLDFNKEEYGNLINCSIDDSLIVSYFPFRSKEQILSHVLVNYPNLLCREDINPNLGFHKSPYEDLFFKIKLENNVDEDDIFEFIQDYFSNDSGELNIVKRPMNLNFCENISIKYDFSPNIIYEVLDNYVNLAKQINIFNKNEINEKNKIEGYTRIIEILQNENNCYRLENADLIEKLSTYQRHADGEKLLHINYLNCELSNYKMEVSNLKNQLEECQKLQNCDFLNNGVDEELIETRNTIKHLISKNKEQESYIKELLAENNKLKNH